MLTDASVNSARSQKVSYSSQTRSTDSHSDLDTFAGDALGMKFVYTLYAVNQYILVQINEELELL